MDTSKFEGPIQDDHSGWSKVVNNEEASEHRNVSGGMGGVVLVCCRTEGL